jgi:hypothetical protein
MKFLKICLLIYLILSLTLPVQLLGDEGQSQNTAKIEAERDANADVNKACWIGAGMTLIGVGIAMMWQSSSPDPGVFAGKSPEYIRAYTDAYGSRVQRIQSLYSLIGCGISSAVSCIFTIAVIKATSNAYEDCLGCLESSEEESGGCSSSPDEIYIPLKQVR